MITSIKDAYVRHYRDNGQTTAYVVWIDHRGKEGVTEGKSLEANGDKLYQFGQHMGALLERANRELRREPRLEFWG